MITPWMLYCMAVSALLGVGAAALERALHAFGRPLRWGWSGALLLSATLPLTLHYAPTLRTLLSAPPAEGLAVGAVSEGSVEVVPVAVEPPTRWEALAERADALLVAGWAAATLLLLAGVAGGVVALRLRRRSWRRARVAGVPVLVSPGTGPAVVGLLRGEIVLPEWALGWDEPRQRLMVEHEREHLRAGDARLLFAALVAAALVPWNLPLWWQLRRLRLAAEVDCDARVLRRRPDVRSYGNLLLEVGRLASSGRLPAAALSEPQSFLERRIRMMTSSNAGRRLRLAAATAGVCALAAVAAGALPVPARPRFQRPVAPPALPAANVPADTIPAARGTVYDVAQVGDKPVLVNGDDLARRLDALYPPLLKNAGVRGEAQVALVVDERGAVAEARVLSASHPAFGEAASTAIRDARFRPAKHEGKPVAVRVTMPFTFGPDRMLMRGVLLPEGVKPRPHVPDTVPLPAGVIDVARATDKPRLANGQELSRLLQELYPPLLREAGISGQATVSLVIDTEGATRGVRAVSASHPAFGEAGVAVMRQARFRPAKNDGKPVAVRITMPISFSLPVVGQPSRPELGEVSETPRALQVAAVLREHHAQLLSSGDPDPNVVWIALDPRGEVVHTWTEPGALIRDLRETPLRERAGDVASMVVRRFEAGALAKGPLHVAWVRLKDA